MHLLIAVAIVMDNNGQVGEIVRAVFVMHGQLLQQHFPVRFAQIVSFFLLKYEGLVNLFQGSNLVHSPGFSQDRENVKRPGISKYFFQAGKGRELAINPLKKIQTSNNLSTSATHMDLDINKPFFVTILLKNMIMRTFYD